MTTRLSVVAVVMVCCVPVLGRGDEDAKAARAALDRGIKALGGAKLLADRALTGTSRGTIFVLGMKSTVTNEWTVQGLDQIKWVSDVKLNDNPAAVVLVIDKDKGWTKANTAAATPMPKELLTAFQHGILGLRLVETLVPLTEKEWKLSSLGELKIDDKPAVGIKVAKKGVPEMDIYFDKATDLPIKAEMRIKEQGGTEAVYLARFDNYKKIEGRMYFTKLNVKRDDVVVIDMERSDVQAKDKVDDATFDKP